MQEDGMSAPGPGEAAEVPKIKVTRRQPCPCGSGKKFKSCCEGDPRYEVAEIGAEAQPVSPDTLKKAPAFSPKGGPKPASLHQGPPQQRGGKSSTVHHRRV